LPRPRVSDRDRIEPVKDEEPRLVRLSPTLRAVLTGHLEPGVAVLFPTKTGGRLDHRYFAGRVGGRILRQAGLLYRKPHALRHPYAVSMFESGAHLRLVRDQMGHSTVAITADVYDAHVDPDRQVRAVEELDRTLGLAPERPPGTTRRRKRRLTPRLFGKDKRTYTPFTTSARASLAANAPARAGRDTRRQGCLTTRPRTH
jgi:hypothetical protein